jgi:hypothetical protein
MTNVFFPPAPPAACGLPGFGWLDTVEVDAVEGAGFDAPCLGSGVMEILGWLRSLEAAWPDWVWAEAAVLPAEAPLFVCE